MSRPHRARRSGVETPPAPSPPAAPRARLWRCAPRHPMAPSSSACSRARTKTPRPPSVCSEVVRSRSPSDWMITSDRLGAAGLNRRRGLGSLDAGEAAAAGTEAQRPPSQTSLETRQARAGCRAAAARGRAAARPGASSSALAWPRLRCASSARSRPSIACCQASAGIGRKTRRRRRSAPHFRDQLSQRRGVVAEIGGQLLANAPRDRGAAAAGRKSRSSAATRAPPRAE